MHGGSGQGIKQFKPPAFAAPRARIQHIADEPGRHAYESQRCFVRKRHTNRSAYGRYRECLLEQGSVRYTCLQSHASPAGARLSNEAFDCVQAEAPDDLQVEVPFGIVDNLQAVESWTDQPGDRFGQNVTNQAIRVSVQGR